MNTISAGSAQVRSVGRIDWSGEGAHCFWPGAQFMVRFTGTSLSAELETWVLCCTVSLGVVVDGRLSSIAVRDYENGKRRTIVLADQLEPDREHELLFFKKHDNDYHFVLHSYTTDGEFLTPPPEKKLKLEFYGDSVTAGHVVEAVDFCGRCDPPGHDNAYHNPWYSYAWQTARNLDADVMLTAQGGIAVFAGTGWFHWPHTIGMDTSWDKMCYFPEGGGLTQWNFSRYTPDAVVFAIGQNDQHDTVRDDNSRSVKDPEYRLKWKEAYKAIARGVASHYPASTKYVFITTVLAHDVSWDDAITEAADELRQEGIATYRYLFKRNGCGTLGHPRIQEQKEMADELTAFLKTIL